MQKILRKDKSQFGSTYGWACKRNSAIDWLRMDYSVVGIELPFYRDFVRLEVICNVPIIYQFKYMCCKY